MHLPSAKKGRVIPHGVEVGVLTHPSEYTFSIFRNLTLDKVQGLIHLAEVN
jgi:hypothetical protein